MADPAVEAAERAERESGWWKDPYSQGWNQEHAVAAAREMAAPIRELHTELSSDIPGKPSEWNEAYGDGMRYVLDHLAPLIYTTEELNR